MAVPARICAGLGLCLAAVAGGTPACFVPRESSKEADPQTLAPAAADRLAVHPTPDSRRGPSRPSGNPCVWPFRRSLTGANT